MTDLPIIVGIDPGSKWTGVVVLDENGRLLEHTTITRNSTITLDMYLVEVCQELATVLRKAAEQVDMDPSRVVVAIEKCVKPNPHVRRKDGNSTTNPQHIIDTALVAGMLTGWITASNWAGRFVRVDPGKHGDLPPGVDPKQAIAARLYPGELFSPQESKGTGHGIMHHRRAAYSIATTYRDHLRLTRSAR